MKILIALILIIFVGVGVVWFFQKSSKKTEEKPLDTVDVLTGLKALDIKTRTIDPELAIAKAKEVYRDQQAQGIDFSNGPCLSNELFEGWVADIAHSPRIAADNLLENQCSAFHEGGARHFVELDPNGNVIQVY